MFNFRTIVNAAKESPGAFFIVLLVVVIFFSAPFIWLWRLAKRTPVVGQVLEKVPGAKA